MPFLTHAGSVAKSIVKHVPARGALWGAIGFGVGALCIVLSFVIGLLALERGALLLGYLLAIPAAIPFLGAALFFVHGLHRGAARAALELETKFGLVRYVVDRVLKLLEDRVGTVVANVPLARFETQLKESVDQYVRSDDWNEGKGLAAWAVGKAKASLIGRIDTYLLAAYRAETQDDGTGGGVSLRKIGDRVALELSGRLSTTVMGALNKQLLIFMTVYVVVATGWWYWLFLVMRLFTKD